MTTAVKSLAICGNTTVNDSPFVIPKEIVGRQMFLAAPPLLTQQTPKLAPKLEPKLAPKLKPEAEPKPKVGVQKAEAAPMLRVIHLRVQTA